MYAARVYRPIYGTVPRVCNETLRVCFLRVGVNRSVVVKSLNQVNKS